MVPDGMAEVACLLEIFQTYINIIFFMRATWLNYDFFIEFFVLIMRVECIVRSFITSALHQEDEMGREYSTNRVKEECLLNTGEKTSRQETTGNT
jgi:hypothetical protein